MRRTCHYVLAIMSNGPGNHAQSHRDEAGDLSEKACQDRSRGNDRGIGQAFQRSPTLTLSNALPFGRVTCADLTSLPRQQGEIWRLQTLRRVRQCNRVVSRSRIPPPNSETRVVTEQQIFILFPVEILSRSNQDSLRIRTGRGAWYLPRSHFLAVAESVDSLDDLGKIERTLR